MADLAALQQFAADHAFGLTAPLNHARVMRLAEYWLPEMRFYWDERFHPVTLDDVFAMVEDGFARLPPEAQDAVAGHEVRARRARAGRSAPSTRRSSMSPTESVPVPAPQGGTQFRKVVRVLNEGTPGRATLPLPEVGTDTVITHGASFGRSSQFFGPLGTMSGNATGDRGRPLEAARRRTRSGAPRRAPAPRHRHGRAAQPPRPAEVRAGHRRGGGGRLRLPARRHARVRHHPEPLAPGDIGAARPFRRPSSASSCWRRSRRTRRAGSSPSRPRAGGSTAWPGTR